jgi:hypothetical protein
LKKAKKFQNFDLNQGKQRWIPIPSWQKAD